MSVTEIIVIDDSSAASSQPVSNVMQPRSFYSGHGVTSNTASKRKLRPRDRQRLPLQPISGPSYTGIGGNRNHNKKGKTTSIKRKRKRDRNQSTIEETASSIDTQHTAPRHLSNGRTPRSLARTHNYFNPAKKAYTSRAPRRSARIQNKSKRRKLNDDEEYKPPLIDLSTEQNDDDDDTSHSSNSNHKMSIDDASDVELMEDDHDIDMQDVSAPTNTNNNHNTHSVVDLEDDDDIDIDINDIELPLFGIAIGKHQDFWTCKEHEIKPQIIMNKHTNTIQMKLCSIHGGHYVSVSLKTSEIKALYLPQNPSFFDIDDIGINPSLLDEAEEEGHDLKSITSYLQIIFIQTKSPLNAYQWLSEYYNPNDMTHPGIERITLIMGCKQYQRFKALVMNKSFFCELRNAISPVPDDEKQLWIKNLSFGRATKRAWKKYDKERTLAYLEKLVGLDTDVSEEEEEEEGKTEAIDITTESPMDELIMSEIDIDDSGDFSEYIANTEILLNPHHSNSLIYAKTRKSEPSKTLECYWVFPAQHEHRQSIMHIETKDYSLVCTEDEYLNDTIIDFQLKYTYASWPNTFKDNVYIFTSFFWKKLMKIRKRDVAPQDIKQLFRWSKRIKSLFDKRYIIIPKCEHNHWELVIVAHAGKVLKRYLNTKQPAAATSNDFNGYNDAKEEEELEQPCIAILDSLQGRGKASEFGVIRKWLDLEAHNYMQRMRMNEENNSNHNNNNSKEEAENGENVDKIFTAKSIAGYIVKVPRQPNGHDCGCFLLRNVLQFGMDGGFKDTSCKKKMNLGDWYDEEDGVGYRKDIASNLARLIREQKGINSKLRLQHTNRKKQLVREQIQKRKEKEKEKEKRKEIEKKKANDFKGYDPS